jgi:hypothetical protein
LASYRSESEAYSALMKHLDTLEQLQRKARSKQNKWRWAAYFAEALVSPHHLGAGQVLLIIENADMMADMAKTEKVIERIFREYPQLKREYKSDAALVEIQSMKNKYIVAGDPRRMPELGKRRHVRVQQRGSLFEADEGDGYGHKNLTADECYRSFIKGTNRVSEARDGWVHFWYEPE